MRTREQVAFLPSLSRTTDQDSKEGLENPSEGKRANINAGNNKGMVVVTNISANPGTLGSIKTQVWGVDSFGVEYLILESANLTAVHSPGAPNVLRIHPALTAAANLVASDIIPANYFVKVVHNNANPITYTCSFCLVD